MYLRFGRLKRIKLRHWIIWALLLIVLIFLLTELCQSVYHSLDNTQTQQITVDRLYLDKAYRLSATDTLYITAGSQKYLCPLTTKKSLEAAQEDLLSGQVRTVTVLIHKTPTLRERIYNRMDILELRSENRIYHSLEDQKALLRENRAGAWIAFGLFGLVFAVDAVITLLGNGIFTRHRKK